MPHTRVHFWWVTGSERGPKRPWHWDNFLSHPKTVDWGGPDWINSPMSFKRIQRMRKGDLVIAYQAGEGILGLTSLASNGYKDPKSIHYDTFDLERTPTVWLRHAVPLHVVQALPRSSQNFEFVRVLQGTVFRVREEGFRQVLFCSLAFNEDQAKAIRPFLSLSGMRL